MRKEMSGRGKSKGNGSILGKARTGSKDYETKGFLRDGEGA